MQFVNNAFLAIFFNFLLLNTAQAADAEQIYLDAITVTATATKNHSQSAILGDADVFDLPLSTTILNEEDFAERMPKDIADMADYAAGVSRRANYWGVNTPTFQLRGFNAGDATAYYKDGFRYQGRAPMSMANVEGVEILRGPVSALYGWAEPGGAVQVLVKKPSKQSIKKVSLQYDEWDKATVNVDFGGSLNDNLAYRLVLAREQGGSFRDNQDLQQTLIAPSLTIELDANKKLDLALEFLDDKRSTDYGIPAINGKPANVPIDRIYTESFGEQHSQSTRLSARWQQPLMGGDLSTALSFYQFKYLKYNDAEPYRVSGNNVLRTYEDYPEQYRWLTAYADWSKAIQTGAVKHQLATRFEAAHEKRELKNGVFDEYPAIDVFNPVYNQTYIPTPDYNLFSQGWRNTSFALALQDTISWGDWKALLGVRQSFLRQSHYLTEVLPIAINNRTAQTDTATTPRIGIVWQVQPEANIYANYSAGKMGVLPQNRAFNDDSFAPISSKQFELGLKVQPLNKLWLASAAAFSIERNNVLTPDPDHAGFSIQTGTQKSRGLEFGLQGAIAENWQLNAQTTLLDATITKDNRYAAGNRLPYAARVGASAWLTHTMFFENNSQLSLSGGVVYQGERFAGFTNTTTLPSHTRLDLGASYQLQHWTINVGLENVLDKTYYSSGIENRPAVIYPGAPRSLSVKASYRFD